jgi:CzcA family heavy metal efflux pump
MLAKLIEFSLKRPSLILLIAAGVLFLGGLKVASMPVDVFPELNAPTVVVMTEAGGLAADEVETNITFPLETSVNGLPGTRRVRSASATSLSFIWVEFDWGTDIYRARQMVAERIAPVELPEGAHTELTPITSITGEVMLLALSSPDGTASPLDLRSFAEFDLRSKLLAVPGVAQAVAIGGDLPQYQVNIDQDRLALYGLTFAQAVEAARAAHSTASAGYLANVEFQEVPIRQMAQIRNVSDLASTIVTYKDGAAITLADIADITLGPAPKRGTAADRGQPAVVVSVQKSPGTNTLALTRQIDAALDSITLPKGVSLNRDPFRDSRFIERSINNVVRVLVEATIIVAIILILFLMNARATIITLTALPLSLAMSLIILWASGLSINVMTLGGLAVAIGELVDDAIIDVENVLRRLIENAALPADQAKPFTTVVYDASNEVRSSVVFATIIICMVFLPLLFLDGLEGRFFQPLGIAYITSIFASLLVALTVTPALCKLLFHNYARRTGTQLISHHDQETRLVRWLKHLYARTLATAMRARALVLGATALLTAASLLLASTFGTSFLPAFNEGTFTVFLMAPPGTSLQESDRLARGVEARLATIDGVVSVTRRTGRAERDEHAEPVSSSEIEVTLTPGADKDGIRATIDSIISNVPGITTMIGQPIEHRLSHVLSGTPAAIAINIFGDDLDVLRSLAKKVEAELKQLPGTRDVTANREVMILSAPIRYRHADLAAHGLTPASAAQQVQQSLYGETVAQVNQGTKRIDVAVRLDPSQRERVDQLADLRLTSPREDGSHSNLRLGQIADISLERTSNLIARENAQRKAVVSTNVADGYNLGELVGRVQSKVDPIVRAAGYSVVYGGQFQAQQSAARTLIIMGAGVAVLMLILLQLSTGSWRTACLVMLNLPMALIGGIIAVYLSEGPGFLVNTAALLNLSDQRYIAPVVSIASMVGFITLFGIAVRNGILLVNHYRHLIEHNNLPVPQAVRQGSLERLVPILMTALTAALGLLPLAYAKGQPGSELLAPLAIVVLGGLISSTLLNLFVVPIGYALLFSPRRS